MVIVPPLNRTKVTKCDCGNTATDTDGKCDHCAFISDQPTHMGHWAHITGTWYCDTCQSPYCELI